jgi:CPA1 family monovalent cation:H+ antiporter
VLSALAVVLGTLIVQGVTLGPLIRFLRFEPDRSFDEELAAARVMLLDTAIFGLRERDDDAARFLREAYRAERRVASQGHHPRAVNEGDPLRRRSIAMKRERLAGLRRAGKIDDDVFHALEKELDWAELAASPPEKFELVEG